MLRVENLSFHYDHDPPVLQNLTLTIQGGASATARAAAWANL